MKLCEVFIIKQSERKQIINNNERSRIEGESHERVYCENTAYRTEIAGIRRSIGLHAGLHGSISIAPSSQPR